MKKTAIKPFLNGINISLAADDNYVRHMAVTIKSILSNRVSDDYFNFYIIDGGISDANKQKLLQVDTEQIAYIEFLKIDFSKFSNCSIGECSHLSIAAYYRLLLSGLLPDVDKIIYLDCDIVVKSSLSALFNYNIDNYYFGGVPDVTCAKQAKRLNLQKYCNSGVMLINLKKWREENIEAKLFEYIKMNSSEILYHDQDVLNVVLQSGILYLDMKWNVQAWELSPPDALDFKGLIPCAHIIHFIGSKKPWVYNNNAPARKEYFKYSWQTPWKWQLLTMYLLIFSGLNYLMVGVKKSERSIRIFFRSFGKF